MDGILDRVEQSRARAYSSHFQPASPDELFALRLAFRLGEPAAARHYLELLDKYSQEQLLVTYKRVQRCGSHLDPARSFHKELERITRPVAAPSRLRRILAIRLERRTITAVVFLGQQLEYPPLLRHLRKTSREAVASTAGFVSRILDQCDIAVAALERPPENTEVQRHALAEVVGHVLSEEAITSWQVDRQQLITDFAHPSPRSRTEVRAIISRMWPDVGDSFSAPLVKDALALGLMCHTESLFDP
ncbi:MAG TPA: hypothetical protein VN736_10715 [Candidatus Limnocylindrales bacterium]|nr:hypothetical protein [Candidatus Limnocylindrales bacterium]